MRNDPQLIISWYEWLISIENLSVSFVFFHLHICANFFNSKLFLTSKEWYLFSCLQEGKT